MILGLIGHPLGHSWSSQIHTFLIHEKYVKWDLMEDELADFLQKRDFDGINVTIPYKQAVIPMLDALDPAAKRIGAVNCIVNTHGICTGYNTDAIGFRDMVLAHNLDVKGKHTALLGTGGASRAVRYALVQLGAEVQLVSRSPKEGCITYEQLYQDADTYQYLVNVTPVGMYPNTNESVVDLARFSKLEEVIDIVANPLRTKLMFDAKMLSIPCLGGFEMLVRQAFAADELFTGKKLDPSASDACMKYLYGLKRNVVFIGMPTSGKSTLAKMLGKQTNRDVIEMDDEIEKRLGTSIKECFATKGEAYFRQVEQKTAEDIQNKEHCIISCGGGVIKNENTMRAVSQNGIVIWIQKDIRTLFATNSRPLTGDGTYMKKLYEDRRNLYQKYCDAVVVNDGSLNEAVEKIKKVAGD